MARIGLPDFRDRASSPGTQLSRSQIASPRDNRDRSKRVAPDLGRQSPDTSNEGLSVWVYALVISAFLPWMFTIGTVVVSPYKLVLLLITVPSIIALITRRPGRIILPDVLVFFFCIWAAAALVFNHGLATSAQAAGVLFLETMGSYAVARNYIRSPSQFRRLAILLFWIMVVLLPLAIAEGISGSAISLELGAKILPTHPIMPVLHRWGLKRVQGVFEHPILFGVTCGGALSLIVMVAGYHLKPARRFWMAIVAVATGGLSLSAGPITAMIAQIALMLFNYVLRSYKSRWTILGTLVLGMYLFISVMSNQSAPAFFISRFAFDEGSAYYRILIWNFGTSSVANHFWFGVGFNRWDRPEWMPPSIDMFWLYNAIIYGLPAALLMAGAFLSSLILVGKATAHSERVKTFKLAYMFTMAGYFTVGWTVHFWGGTYVLFMFLLGSGSWIAHYEDAIGKEPSKRKSTATL